MGVAACGNVTMPFLEICSLGLFSALFESGDDIQHGNISSIGNFLSTLTNSPASEIHLLLDDKREIKCTGYVTLVSNMPYFGRHIHIGSPNSFRDGLLEILFCPDISKLDLMIGYLRKIPGIKSADDPRFKILRVRSAEISTTPAMPVMADGISLGEGSVSIGIRRHTLSVVVPVVSGKKSESGENSEK
jgi:diacylglycerol kinase family enzyme